MNTALLRVVAPALLLATFSSFAATLYVDVNSTNPVPPYTNWATAANVIQDAVDAASPGDTVLVTNGVYSSGGKAVYGTMTNRVAVDKPLALLSMNGPEATIIQGYQIPGITNGDGAIRCVYLTNGAFLSGFTLTNGATKTSGDFFKEVKGGGLWGESTNAMASNCLLAGNSAHHTGGGAYRISLIDCALQGNSAWGGGGAADSMLNMCMIAGNSANTGGGSYFSTLLGCVIADNSARFDGGGVDNCVLTHCTVIGNAAGGRGGGSLWGTLNNSIVYFNTVQGAVNNHSLSTFNYSCTTPLPTEGVGNISSDPRLASASHLGADSPCRQAGSSALTMGTDIDGEAWAMPASMGCDEIWIGAITGALSVAMSVAFTNVAVDFQVEFIAHITGRTVASTWDFGDATIVSNQPYARHAWTTPGDHSVVLRAYNETWPGGLSATTIVHVAEAVHYVAADASTPVPPYDSWATAARTIQDAVDSASVPGSLVLVSNGTYASGGKAVYGTLTNRVAVNKPLRLLSVNGPELTRIQGYRVPGTTNGDDAVRCVYLTNGASLIGFTLTNGATRAAGASVAEQDGGGFWCESKKAWISNCVVTGNSAYRNGGGGYFGTLINCLITQNSARVRGGGVCLSTVNDCTLTGNSAGGGGGASDAAVFRSTLRDNWASSGGGGALSCMLNGCALTGNSAAAGGGGSYGGETDVIYNCTITGNSSGGSGGGVSGNSLNNCIVYFNSANAGGDNYYISDPTASVNRTCTAPLPIIGHGNFTNAPLFVNTNNWADLRLQSNSPCINAGNNAYVTNTTDLDGNPRIVGGTVDMGAYEFQSPQSVISYAYLQQYGLPTDGSVDLTDADNDKATTWQEWKAWTDPANELSVLKLLTPQLGTNGTVVPWQSVAGHSYRLERATNGTAAFTLLQSGIAGQAGTTSFTDTIATNGGSFLYRVGVPE